jgi:hypothetical protein
MQLQMQLMKGLSYNPVDNTITFQAGCNHGEPVVRDS